MNWTDVIVLGIILAFTVMGVKNGFLYSVFNLLSYILSVVFAIKFYPVLSGMLQQTAVYANVKTAIVEGIMKKQAASVAGIKGNAAQTVIEGLKLPGFLKEYISKSIEKSNLTSISKIVDAIGSEIATLVINILSVILIYLIIRIALMFIKVIIKTISKLPVFKQLDKTGGFVLGAIEGLLVVYILCAVLILFSAFPRFAQTIEIIEDSKVANYFYQNNFIVSWMEPEKQALTTLSTPH